MIFKNQVSNSFKKNCTQKMARTAGVAWFPLFLMQGLDRCVMLNKKQSEFIQWTVAVGQLQHRNVYILSFENEACWLNLVYLLLQTVSELKLSTRLFDRMIQSILLYSTACKQHCFHALGSGHRKHIQQ